MASLSSSSSIGTASALKSVYNSGKYSDLKISCGNMTFSIHKAIVCSRSSVLAKMVDSVFTESKSMEIYLRSEESCVMQRILDFIYTSTYSDIVQTQQDTDAIPATDIPSKYDAFTINAKVYLRAGFYKIEDLKILAAEKYRKVAAKSWTSSEFARSISFIYANLEDGDRRLRRVICSVAKKHLKDLLKQPEFAILVKNEGEFAYDLLSYTEDGGEPHDVYCHSLFCERRNAVAVCEICSFSGNFKTSPNAVKPRSRSRKRSLPGSSGQLGFN